MKIAFRNRNAQLAADRLFEFYERRMQGRILAIIDVREPAQKIDEPQDPEADLVKERDPISWKHLDRLLERTRSIARSINIKLIEDDRGFVECEPAFHFEGGLETAMLGGEVKWVGTKYHTYGEAKEPLIKNYEEFDWKFPAEDNIWFQRFLESFRYMVKHGDGEFVIGYMCVCNGMDLAVQLRGAEQSYCDIYEHPDELHRLIEWGYKFNKFIYDRVIEIIEPYNQNLYSDHPLQKYSVIPRMGVDAYSQCAHGTLSTWGLKELSLFSTYVGGTAFHIHENSRHIIEEFVKINDILRCWFSDGKGYPRTFDIRWDIRRRMQDIPILISCEEEEFIQSLRKYDLPGNIMYSFSMDLVKEANELMEEVREYRTNR